MLFLTGQKKDYQVRQSAAVPDCRRVGRQNDARKSRRVCKPVPDRHFTGLPVLCYDAGHVIY